MPEAPLVTLPNGLRIRASAFEARVLYHEIFETRAYFRQGIDLPRGATVLDVGANIGMFSLYLAHHHPDATVHAIEPVPDTFAALEANLAAYRDRVTPRRVALGAARGTAELTVDPTASFAATMREADVAGARRDDSPSARAEAAMRDLPRLYPGSRLARVVAGSLSRPWARALLVPPVRAVLASDERRRARRVARVECEVTTLSDFLRENAIDRVDLLKVDVEGAEEEVLAGVEDEHWPRVRQIVVEAHDVAGRVARLRGLLEGKGYRVVEEAEDWAIHSLLGITTLFARRPPDGPPPR